MKIRGASPLHEECQVFQRINLIYGVQNK